MIKIASTRQAKKKSYYNETINAYRQEVIANEVKNVKNPLAIFWIEDCGKDLC